jgi:hypothetical protein
MVENTTLRMNGKDLMKYNPLDTLTTPRQILDPPLHVV